MAFGDFTVDRNNKKYVLGSGGTIVEVAEDVPAIEFNADGSYKGLLVEPQAINVCKWSEDFTTTWANSGSTEVANATTAPDGNATADKLIDDNVGGGATGNVAINQSITVSAATKYTASVFLKTDQEQFAALQALGTGNTEPNPYQFFGLSGAGSLGTAVGLDDSSITAYPNGWYRCSITFTMGAGDTNFSFSILVADSISNANVPRDGTSSIFVWGAQVETGPIATSYIPTQDQTNGVTRVKDNITQTGAQSLIGQTQGTLFVEVDWKETSGAEQYLLSVNDGGFSNRILIANAVGELRMYAKANNVTLSNQGQSSTAYSGIQKLAFAYAEGDFELYRNGSSISSLQDPALSLAALATMTDIDLGQANNASVQANMHIRAAALYPTRLGAVELEVLTGAPTYGSYAIMASSLGYTV